MKNFRALSLLCAIATGAVTAQTTTLNLSQDLVRLAAAPANMAPNQSALDSGPLLESAIRYATSHQITRVIADPGAYYFLSASATSPGAHVAFAGPATVPLTIDLQGSDVYLARQGSIGIFITGGSNLTLQNLTIDYLQQNYTQALVTGVNASQRQIQFTVQPGWQNPTDLNALTPAGAATAYVYVFRDGQPWTGFTRMPAQAPFSNSVVTLTSAIATSTVAAIRPGDVAVIQVRNGGNAILANGVTGATLRNIKIYSGGSGVRLLRCSSSLLEHVEVMPRPGTDRLISTVADGFQPQQLGSNNIIRLCRSIRTCDDGFSPVTFVFGSVQGVTGARSLQVQGDANTALNAGSPLPNGSNVVFERASDGAAVASAIVVSQVAAPVIAGLPEVVLTFDRDLPTGLVGTYVYSTDASWRGGGLLMERNTVQQGGWARGISVWGIMNGALIGNYIHRTAMAGIDIKHQLFSSDWLVPPAVNLTVANNVIDGSILAPDNHTLIELGGIESSAVADNQAPMTSSPHQNLSFTANFIANPGRSALWVGNAASGLVDSNYFFAPNDNPNASLAYAPYAAQELQPLVLQSSPGVAVGANTIDQSSRRAFVTDSGYRELAAYAPGATFRLNAYNLGTLASPSASLTDADGKAWPLTIAASSTHAVDVSLPAGVGLGAAVVSLNAGNLSYFGTLFIDNQDNIPALNQATFLVSPSTTAVPADPSTIPFLVVTQPAVSYSVTAADSFVTVGSAGTGTGVVTVTFARNSGAARTATIEIAGQPVTLSQAGAADPVFTAPPQSQTVASGSPATFSVSATGAQGIQWYFNGVAIPGATQTTLTLNNATAASAGTYTAVARSGSNATTSSGGLLSISNIPGVSRLSNLSILTTLTSADPLFTIGTVVAGAAGSKPLLIRAAGPALAALGVGGVLADPKLDVFTGQAVSASNDDWGGTAAMGAAFAAVGAFPYAAANSKDSAVFNPALPVGSYTIQVSGVAGATGTVIAELYDSTPPGRFTPLTPRLINVSVLKQINAGDTLTAGFVIAGPAPKAVLIRAVGATLGTFGVTGVMADPKLDLFSGQTVIASNDNWGTPVGAAAATAAQLTAVFTQVGAFNLSAGSKDAALLITLAPGNYTAQVNGVNNTGGQALVEVYEVP